ncbi:MAG: NUDIX hydrolase [Actinobacteria bacterium]|nr:NUDIX hydrolase [Actinomycetota bacterium]
MAFERIGSESVYDGKIFTVRRDRFRYEDGEEADREIVAHPGAVGVVAHDGERLYLVRQPREAVDDDSVLEIPAGKLDEEGEEVVETAKRELAEEIGKGAREWRLITRYWSSVGFTDEEVHVYLATNLYDESADAGEEERIEVDAVPLDRLDEVIASCRDAKTLVGLLWLKAYGG